MPLEVRSGGNRPKYSKPDLFTIEIHHGGHLKDGKYVGGLVQWVDNFDADLMSMLDIYDVAVSLGYNHLQTVFHYKDKVKGFFPLIADADVSEFVSHIPSFRVQVLYLTNNGQWGDGWDNWFETEVLATDLDNHLVDATVQCEKGVNVEASVNQRVDVKIFDVDADDEYENENEDDEDVGDDDEVGSELDMEEDDGAREESENDFEYVDSDYVQSENDTEVVKDDTLFERFVVDEAFEASHKAPGEISTDEYNSEELVSLDEEEHSDEEGIVVKNVRRKRKASRFKQFRREMDLLNPTFYLGMEFPDMKACREAVMYYSVAISRPLHWSRSHFNTNAKCDILLNNLCESCNAAILEARDKPILTLLQGMHSYLMLRMARVRETIWNHEVGPRIFEIVEKYKIESFLCMASYASGGKYQVNHLHGGMYAVDLEGHTCSCRKWDLCGIPCTHVITAIGKKERKPLDYVHSCYKRPTYERAYKGYISPMPGPKEWRKTGLVPIKPPLYHKQPGRPKTCRKKGS